MTDPMRGAPSSDAGSTLPFDALTYQNQLNADIKGLWNYVVLPLFNVVGTNALTAITIPAWSSSFDGMTFRLRPVNTNTGSVTLNINSTGIVALNDRNGNALAAGALKAGGVYLVTLDSTSTTYRVLIDETSLAALQVHSPQGYLTGLQLANNSGTPNHYIDVTAGVARDSTNTLDLTGSAWTKRMNTAFSTGNNGGAMLQSAALAGTVAIAGTTSVVGTGTAFLTDFQVGGVITTNSQSRRITVITDNTHLTVESLFTGTLSGLSYTRGGKAPSTAFGFFIIAKPDGTTDYAFSSRSIPVDLPSGYTLYRRLGYVLTDSSGNNRGFSQIGSTFALTAPHRDMSGGSYASTTSFVADLTAPPDATVKAVLKFGGIWSASGGSSLLYARANNQSASTGWADLRSTPLQFSAQAIRELQVTVSALGNAQVTTDFTFSSDSLALDIWLIGWIDSRGRD